MKKSLSCTLAILPLFITSCNLFGGLSSPSNDAQYLVAARACLDQGDYDCAKQNYEALSNSYNDVKISEESLALLAQGNIFSISDLVASLGTSLGSASSFSFLAEAMESRGITNGSHRTTIKTVFDNDAQIQDAKLKAFSQFLAALAMFNELLANAIGSDGKLTASDIVDSASLSNCLATQGIMPGSCPAPAGTALTFNVSDASLHLATAGNDWSTPATIQKLINAAAEASSDYSLFGKGNTNQNLLATIQSLAGISGTEDVTRYGIINILGLK